ncbi:flagellar protein FliT [Pseudomonas putida]|jgi:flagellar protein FliT|uniref:flagellar protein FliT n=1 Tax=Pseudomonas putida TaxID=303 RepID=UPI0023639640|nr:flagellar protein FliT [Pseudomonas putida]MDD2055469.1 flagellar protein FliT [Pseudomonas putida]
MSHALQRIEESRDALIGALEQRDWDAIGELDIACRSCIDEALSEAPVDEAVLREQLESLLAVYRQLLEVTKGERQAIVNEMSQITQAQSAAKVYHLFG